MTLRIGSKISFPNKGEGTIEYIGRPKNKDEAYVGIRMVNPNGKNNGYLEGQKYFDCEEGHGLFCTLEKIQSLIRGEIVDGNATGIADKYKNLSIKDISRTEETESLQSDGVQKEKIETGFKNEADEKGEINITKERVVEGDDKNDPESYDIKNLSIILEEAIDENSNNIDTEKISNLNCEKLKLIYKTKKLYTDSKISALNSQIKKLKKRCLSNSSVSLAKELNELREENFRLKSTQMRNMCTKEQIDEFVLGITKDCLKMKRGIYDISEILARCKKDKIHLANERVNMFYLTKDLVFAIMDEDEEKVEKYYEKFAKILEENGIQCSLD